MSEPSGQLSAPLNRDAIRAIFLANGFTIKEGQTDLKDYVYDAAAELIRVAQGSTPSAQWRVDGEPDPHGERYDTERAALTMGNLTDDELANGAYMNYDRKLSIQELVNPRPGIHTPLVWMTAVKDRIRWLSRALEKAQARA